MHEEVVKLDQDFGATFSGVLTDDDGRVRALWGSYAEQVGRLCEAAFALGCSVGARSCSCGTVSAC